MSLPPACRNPETCRCCAEAVLLQDEYRSTVRSLDHALAVRKRDLDGALKLLREALAPSRLPFADWIADWETRSRAFVQEYEGRDSPPF